MGAERMSEHGPQMNKEAYLAKLVRLEKAEAAAKARGDRSMAARIRKRRSRLASRRCR